RGLDPGATGDVAMAPPALARVTSLTRHRPDRELRVEAGSEPFHAPVEMRRRHSPGGADRADRLTLADVLTDRDAEAREMGVAGGQAVAMVDQHGIAGKEQLLGEAHDPAR